MAPAIQVWRLGVFTVPAPLTHVDVIEWLHERYGNEWRKGYIQGFMTNTMRFVNRYRAAKIAWRAGQIDHLPNILFSEDLW